MPMLNAVTAISRNYSDIARNPNKFFFEKKLLILIGIFFPGRDDLTASASLRPIRSGRPRHHERSKRAR